jgi:hypothetical protein
LHRPSDPTITTLADISGDQIGGLPGTSVSTTAFDQQDKVQQTIWAGARYSRTDTLTLALAYYRYDQNQYHTNCAASAATAPACAGSLNAASALLDWHFAPKWDTSVRWLSRRERLRSIGELRVGDSANSQAAGVAALRLVHGRDLLLRMGVDGGR